MPSNAVFVPPSVTDMDELLSDMERFIHNDEFQIPHLIKIALIHYQFETIHPFQDGNGRIGRLIIPLYILDKKMLDKPCFYISDYFERNRTTYYHTLQNVRENDDLTGWVTFFLKAVAFTAKSAKEKFRDAIRLVSEYEERVLTFSGRPDNNRSILKAFFNEPILSGKQLQDRTSLSQPTIDKAIRGLIDEGMINEVTGYSRNRIYVLAKYLSVFARDSNGNT